MLLIETIRASGLDAGLSAALEWWRKPTEVYDPAKIVLDLALTLALGGDCLADIALLRAEPGVYGRVASDPMMSRSVDVLATDAASALTAIGTAHATAWARLWRLAGDQAPDHGCNAERPLIGDVDATLSGRTQRKNFLADVQKGVRVSIRCVPSSTTAPPGRGAVADGVVARRTPPLITSRS